MRCKPTLHYQLSDHARFQPAIAYPQVGSFVGYIADTFGTERVLRCFLELERGDDSTVVQDNRRKFEEIIGRPLKDVEQSWRAALQRKDIKRVPTHIIFAIKIGTQFRGR